MLTLNQLIYSKHAILIMLYIFYLKLHIMDINNIAVVVYITQCTSGIMNSSVESSGETFHPTWVVRHKKVEEFELKYAPRL